MKQTVIFMLVAFGAVSFGQAPQKMNYQAVVRSALGAPVANNTPVIFRFTIHDVTANGAIVFTETTDTLYSNQFGLCTAEIGALVNLAAINWGTGAKFLQVEVDVNNSGFMDMGTSQLISVPYALFAGNSAVGPPGPTGVQGLPGPTGATGIGGGATGPTGPTGITGQDGAPGFVGNTGATGVQGIQGPSGATGPQGIQGLTGITGPQGPQGIQGVTGAQGVNGIPGATGPTGENNAWSLTGNTGTNSSNFIGTIDNVSLNIRVNNLHSGIIDPNLGNTSFGLKTLSANTGIDNVAFGSFALEDNTTGSENTAVGGEALQKNTAGFENTALGRGALGHNISGYYNTASGTWAMSSNSTGQRNVAFGYKALFSNDTGCWNTAIGSGTLSGNTTGNFNTAIGLEVLGTNSSGINNTSIGTHSTLYNTFGSNNTAIGVHALRENTTGSLNSALGVGSLITNLTGSNNTALGAHADVGFGNLTNATAIGANSIVSESNSLVLGDNANVGIGTSAPSAKLEVNGQVKITDTYQGTGKVLTSDASGLASWQTPSVKVYYAEVESQASTTSSNLQVRATLTLPAGEYLLTGYMEVFNTSIDAGVRARIDEGGVEIAYGIVYSNQSTFGSWSAMKKISPTTTTNYTLLWASWPSGGTSYIRRARMSAIKIQ